MQPNQAISILIIEDNPGDQLLLQENLKATNLNIGDIAITETLADGISQMKSVDFSLVFLDLFLPDSTGLNSFAELAKINSRVPIIIYSGLSDTNVSLKALAHGAQDFLIKGDYTVSLLEKTVRYSIERKLNIEALQESIDKYNLISKATHDMVWDWDLVTDKVYRNVEGWRKIFHVPPDKEINSTKDWNSKVYPDDRKYVQDVIAEAVSSPGKQLFEAEFRILRDDNTVGYLADRGYIIRDKEGKAIRLIGASHDITERKLAERKVLESELRFKSLVQNGSDLVCILDAEGNFVYVSPTSKSIVGYDPEYFIGKNTFDFMHPDDMQQSSDAFTKVETTKSITVPLFRFRNASGEWRWIESTITNLMDDPAVNGIVINSRDVTGKKNDDDEIKKLSLVARETINGVIISDKEQKIVWVNDAFTKMFGYQLEEVIGKNPGDFLPGPETDAELIKIVQQQKQISKDPISFEMLAYGKTGNKKLISVLIQPIFDELGNVQQSFAIQTDITERKRAEEELKKLSMIAKETHNGVVVRDINQKIVWVNEGFTKMTGYTLEEVMGRRPVDFLVGEETDLAIQDFIDTQRAKNEAFTYEILNYRKNGEKVYVRIQDQSIFNEAGQVIQYMALQTDITLEKKIQEEIALQKVLKQKEITEAVYAAQENERSEIGREMHDNVTQLLGASRLYIDMAKSNEKERNSLLASASSFTLTAIEELRKLSKTLITPSLKENGLVDSIKDLSEEIMLVHPLKIMINTEDFNEDGLQERFKLNVFRILQEQLNNTLKHAKANNIQIVIHESDNQLTVSVADDGTGFDTTKRKTGVGITNIKSRSELYNGVMAFTSVLGKGTRLHITFNKRDIVNKEQ